MRSSLLPCLELDRSTAKRPTQAVARPATASPSRSSWARAARASASAKFSPRAATASAMSAAAELEAASRDMPRRKLSRSCSSCTSRATDRTTCPKKPPCAPAASTRRRALTTMGSSRFLKLTDTSKVCAAGSATPSSARKPTSTCRTMSSKGARAEANASSTPVLALPVCSRSPACKSTLTVIGASSSPLPDGRLARRPAEAALPPMGRAPAKKAFDGACADEATTIAVATDAATTARKVAPRLRLRRPTPRHPTPRASKEGRLSTTRTQALQAILETGLRKASGSRVTIEELYGQATLRTTA
mmetsp:Transcript_76170/g.213576  ORF Transcript_76170/g.213576 Transcript_76170/m.213576 type:complete len:304 (+) Transcript_76170:254-1165(+)